MNKLLLITVLLTGCLPVSGLAPCYNTKYPVLDDSNKLQYHMIEANGERATVSITIESMYKFKKWITDTQNWTEQVVKLCK